MKSKNAEGWGNAPLILTFFIFLISPSSPASKHPCNQGIELLLKINFKIKFQISKPTKTEVVQLVNAHLTFKNIFLGNFTVYCMLIITFI